MGMCWKQINWGMRNAKETSKKYGLFITAEEGACMETALQEARP